MTKMMTPKTQYARRVTALLQCIACFMDAIFKPMFSSQSYWLTAQVNKIILTKCYS